MNLAGVQAWVTLAAGLALFAGRRPACRRIAAEARWWADHRRAEREWRAESDPAYRAELDHARALLAAREEDRLARSAALAGDARALRPWHVRTGEDRR